MENKLQQLTQKLYDEGLSKGRQEAETLVADAKAQAKKIVADAWAEAEKIERDARTKAEDMRNNTMTELNLAAKQAVGKLKQSIQEMVVARAVSSSVADAAMDPAFIREVLVAVARNWQGSSSETISLRAMLPEQMRAKLDVEFEQSILSQAAGGLEIEFSENVRSGFKIGPREGGYYISFTEEGFDALLGEYLRPKVSEILYGPKE